MLWCFVLTVIAVMCLLISIVAVRQTVRTALWCGALLAALALAASLFAPLYLPNDTPPEQTAYVVNCLLVLAAVGANFFAGAICSKLKP